MFSSVKSMGVSGVGGYMVAVEVYISNGLPGFEIVGLPDAAVKGRHQKQRMPLSRQPHDGEPGPGGQEKGGHGL